MASQGCARSAPQERRRLESRFAPRQRWRSTLPDGGVAECARSAPMERRRRDTRSALHRRPRTLPDGGVVGCARSAPLERRRRDRRTTHAGRQWSRRRARGARHWSAEGATGGARVSAGGVRWHTVESQAKRGARDSARSEAIKYVTFRGPLKIRRAAKRTTQATWFFPNIFYFLSLSFKSVLSVHEFFHPATFRARLRVSHG